METLPRETVDCDVHPGIGAVRELVPYLEDYWAELVTVRGLDRAQLNLNTYPPAAPITARPDWRPEGGRPAASAEAVARDLLDPFGIDCAILNPLHGVSVLHSGDLAGVLCTALNEHVARHWLDRDARLRASIVVPLEDPELAAEEIARRAGDPRFVQVLLLAGLTAPLGKKRHWPIFAAAERHGLPVGVHAGSACRHPTAPIGWGSHLLEDYVNAASLFESQLVSLIGEGVFAKFQALKVVFIESGFMWVPPALWRMNKTWRGVRAEVPWIKENPADIVRRHVRFTLQPVDAPPTAAQFEAVLEQLGSDEVLLFSTDHPHWQFDGMAAVPAGLSPELLRKIAVDNPRATYGRLNLPAGQEVSA